MQAAFHAFFLGQFPGLVGVHVFVDAVGQRHHIPQGLGVVALGQQLGNRGNAVTQVGEQGVAVGRDFAQFAAKTLGDEARRAAGDVDVLADQVRVDAGQEVVGVEVHVLVAAVELGGDVVAQPLGVHAQAQVLERVQAGAAALAHFLAAHRQEAVHEHRVGHLAAREMQHGGPEQGVEGDDVLADEVVLLHLGVGHEGVKVPAGLAEVVLERSQIADRRVQPHVKVLARCVRNLDAEVGRIAGNVPITHLGLAVFARFDPLGNLVEHLGLHGAAVGPLGQEVQAALVREFEEEVLRGA